MKAEQPTRPLIRISSTFFWHLNSDFDLEPMPELQERVKKLSDIKSADLTTLYPKMKVGEQVQK